MRTAIIVIACLVMLGGGVAAWVFLIAPGDKPPRVEVPLAETQRASAGGSTPRGTAPAAGSTARLPGFAAPGSGASAAPEPENDFEPGEVLVANAPTGFEGIAQSLGFRTLETIVLGELELRILRMSVPPGTTVPDAVRLLRARFPQATIDAHHRFQPSQGSSLPDSYARQLVGWQGVPDTCGAGVRIGMIDAGVDIDHPALRGKAIEYRAFNKPDRQPGPAEHGTAVAALMIGHPLAGKGWGGLLPGASLVAANMFEINEAGKQVGSARGLLKAVDWMAMQRVHAVNLSIAGPDNKVVRIAFDRARKKGLLLIGAAGNWGSATKPAYPAAYRHVIAVTAISSDRRVYKHANQGRYIDFAAPGVRLWTAVPGGGRFQSGTSFASPYVAALAAIAVATGSGRSPDDVRDLLRADAIDLGAPGRDDVFGWGLIGSLPACAP